MATAIAPTLGFHHTNCRPLKIHEAVWVCFFSFGWAKLITWGVLSWRDWTIFHHFPSTSICQHTALKDPKSETLWSLRPLLSLHCSEDVAPRPFDLDLAATLFHFFRWNEEFSGPPPWSWPIRQSADRDACCQRNYRCNSQHPSWHTTFARHASLFLASSKSLTCFGENHDWAKVDHLKPHPNQLRAWGTPFATSPAVMVWWQPSAVSSGLTAFCRSFVCMRKLSLSQSQPSDERFWSQK